MADSYVCSGATMKCTMGTSTAKLTVLPIRTVYLTGQPMANISDHLSMVNLAPFGRCRSLGFPSTAAATSAHHGHLTPMPCMHNTPFPWMNGKNDYIVKGDPALLKSSTCQCMWGGTISLVTDGQIPTGPADLNKRPKNRFSKNQQNKDGLSAESIMDGIQLALDAAGFAPGLGAVPDLLNAAISALRGNWTDAGLSVVAAVPIVGDVAAGAKIAKKGVNIAKNAKKGEKIAKNAKKAKVAKKVSKAVMPGKGEKLVRTSSANETNKWWEKAGYKMPPYKPGTDVIEVTLTEDKTFVRVFDNVKSSKRGGWIMEADEIKGLSPKQIQDKYALPTEPQFICDVKIGKGATLRKGIANGIDGWGKGGGMQYDMMGAKLGEFGNVRGF